MYFRPVAAALVLPALIAGCASLTESTQQNVLVQTVLDHREIAGVGCVLYNDVGKWFVTTPARITLRKSAGALRIDCQKEGTGWAYEKVDSKVDGNLWGNLALTAGVGYFIDKNTGAGYDYPATLTVVMHADAQRDGLPPPAPGVTLY
ncbi:hypothetical protein [Duganella violaceipulchra]|uniref:Lipoprotein n=1 Tax=Duganella violaceipulchra TaxID=2849652 RepID=A0AA41L107_9BURK|nr:hypothetical protein [Duganella violaceicalia]MBV6319888.1 hypothetical protein [Duganella violaceicalia]MCP2010252.1 hypothetical protein [Duganella violaceicalia]